MNATYNSGATPYVFTDTRHPLWQEVGETYQAPSRVLMTIWDGDGLVVSSAKDFFDASAMSTAVLIDLRPGQYSSVGFDNTTLLNVGIAWGTLIEDATGGSDADTLIGNHATNTLIGGGGADKLDGGVSSLAGVIAPAGQGDGASDLLIGGADWDRYVLRAGGGVDRIQDSGFNFLEFRDLNDVAKPELSNQLWFYASGLGLQNGSNADGSITYTINSPLTLTVAELDISVIFENYASGDFGIRIWDALSTITVTGITKSGDLTPASDPPEFDGLGNVIVSAVASPNRADTLFDSTANDELFGLGGDDELNAFRGGDDILRGGAGRDWLFGGAGADLLEGGADGDRLFGGDERDQLFGNVSASMQTVVQNGRTDASGTAWTDLYSGGDGDDLIYAQGDRDLIFGGAGDDLLVGGAGADHFQGDLDALNASLNWSMTETLEVVNGVERYTYNYVNVSVVQTAGGSDFIYAGAGNDKGGAGLGNDTVFAEDGDDFFFGDEGGDTLLGGAGSDTLHGDSGPDNVAAGGADFLDGGADADFLFGGAFDDTLYGGLGNDFLQGDDYDQYAGSDTLYGGDGTDTLLGAAGDDWLYGEAGDDHLFGEASDGTASGADYLDGGEGDDELQGNGGADTLFGGIGVDVLLGGDGGDTLDGGAGNDEVAGEAGYDVYILSDFDLDTFSEVEGTNRVVVAGTGSDGGLGGSDVAFSQPTISPYLQVAGDALTGFTLDVELSFDLRVKLANGLLGFFSDWEFSDGTTQTYQALVSDNLYQRISQTTDGWALYGGRNDDTLEGYINADLIEGGGGRDEIDGWDGDDTLRGGSGADEIYGNVGSDLIEGGSGDDVLYGNGYTSSFAYNDLGWDTLAGGPGMDKLYGGFGNDTYLFDRGNGGDQIFEQLRVVGISPVGIDRLQFGPGIATSDVALYRVARAAGSDDLIAVVDASGDQVRVDQFFAPAENFDYYLEEIAFADGTVWDRAAVTAAAVTFGTANAMTGTAGDDVFVVDHVGDTVSSAGAGTDLVQSGVTFTLSDPNLENLTLTGFFHVNGTGDTGDNVILGNAGNNALSGGSAGSDTLIGGAGDDTFAVRSGVTVVENPDEGTDTVTVGFMSYVLPDNVENLIFVHPGGNRPGGLVMTLTGNAQDNYIVAPLHNSTWDVIDGGPGADIMVGSRDATFRVDDPGDVLLYEALESDTPGLLKVESYIDYRLLPDFDNLSLIGSGATTAIGNDRSNLLQGLDNAAVNTLAGRAGDDVYRLGLDGDVVVERPDEGSDTVRIAFRTEIDPSATQILLADNYRFANVEIWEVDGVAGKARLMGGDLAETLRASASGSELYGLAGADTLYGSWANDHLDGGAGADIMAGGAFADIYVVDDSADQIIEQATYYNGGSNVFGGIDDVYASVSFVLADHVENLFLTGTASISGTGNSTANRLDGTANTAANILAGGAGDDDYYLGVGDTIVEAAGGGYDEVFSLVSVTLLGNHVERVELLGTADLDGVGNAQANLLVGNAGANTLSGGDGDDELQGMDGSDILLGGAGNDVLWDTSTGSNQFHGGAGNDLLRAGDGAFMDGGEGNDTYQYEVFYGTAVIDSDDATVGKLDTFVTTDGDARLYREGQDLIVFSLEYVGWTVTVRDYFASASPTRIEEFRLGGAVVTASDVAARVIHGSAGADTLTGTALDESISGAGGNDTLRGAGGNDVILGGDGNDTLYADTGDNEILLGGAGDDILHSSTTAGSWTSMYGGAGNDRYVVSTASSVPYAVYESDGEGVDTIETGFDYYDLRSASDNVENLTLTGSLASEGYGNALDNVLTGTAFNDSLWGNEGNDTLNGGAGSDTMRGGLGDDIYVSDASGDSMIENAGEGTDTVLSAATRTLGSNLENLTLTGTSAINATGNALDNVLIGNGAANTLNGAAGADSLRGGAGDDTYVIDASDTVIENVGEGNDLIQSAISYVLPANVERLTLTGTASVNATGNDLNNTLTGNSGANVLDGAAGADAMSGGTGNDTYYVDSAGDTVTESSSTGGTDTVYASVTFTLGSNVERLTLTGTGNIDGSGNALANIITGNSGANALSGGTGADTLIGGAGNDTYTVDNTGDVLTELAGEGTDSVNSSVTYTLGANVENLTLTGTATINATGNALANLLTGNSANNTLTGGDGDDYLDGLGGTDTMVGGLGNDTFVVAQSTDVTTENAGQGTDTVRAGIAWTLGNNVENLVLTGTSAINGTGNTLDNVLTGNTATNSLTGNAGADTLDGGAGADMLTGGTGNDTYRLARGYGADTVVENDATAGNTDIAQFLAGVVREQVWFLKTGNNLEASIIGTSDKLIVKDWYLGSQYRTEQFKTTDDAKTLLAANVQNLVNAMASFSPPAAGQTTLPPAYEAALLPVIAANWT